MITSNSSSLTGCVLGWTSALHPIPGKTNSVFKGLLSPQDIVCAWDLPKRFWPAMFMLSGNKWMEHLSKSKWSYSHSLGLLVAQQGLWIPHWREFQCRGEERPSTTSAATVEYLQEEFSQTQRQLRLFTHSVNNFGGHKWSAEKNCYSNDWPIHLWLAAFKIINDSFCKKV